MTKLFFYDLWQLLSEDEATAAHDTFSFIVALVSTEDSRRLEKTYY